MKFWDKEDRIRGGYLAAFGLLLFSYLLVFYITLQVEKRGELVDHTNKTIAMLDRLLSCLKDAETAVRGYVIVNDETFLKPYYTGLPCVESSLASLKSFIVNDPLQKKRLDSLGRFIAVRIDSLHRTVNSIKANKFIMDDKNFQRGYRGKQLMDEIRSLVYDMQVKERMVLEARISKFSITSGRLTSVNIITLIIAVLLAVYTVVTFKRENKIKKMYRGQLEEGMQNLDATNKELLDLKRTEKFAVSGRLSRTIAHEIRNPLTNILLATEQLDVAIPKNEQTNSYVGMITRNAHRINDLISQLLISTRFSQLDLVLSFVPPILDQALELANDRIELGSISLLKRYSPDTCPVMVDPEKLKIAFLNLIVNAIEAMEPNKGILELSTSQKNNKCVVLIKDNGVGMSHKSISRIFEPYFTMKENRSGLGLTHTQNIILNHKGNISVSSELGKGTTFVITLDCKN